MWYLLYILGCVLLLFVWHGKISMILVYEPKDKSRSKTPDILAEGGTCIIRFSGEQNHNTFNASALIRRPLGESSKQEILECFGWGHLVSFKASP